MEDKVLAYTGHERQAHTTSNTHGNKQPQPQHQPQQPTSHNHPHNQIRRGHVSQPCFFISLSCLIISHQFGFHLSHSCSAYLVTHDCWLVAALMMRMALLHRWYFVSCAGWCIMFIRASRRYVNQSFKLIAYFCNDVLTSPCPLFS